jgi:hypothetical protein
MSCGVQGIDDDPTFKAFNPRPVRGTQVNPLPAIGSSKFSAATSGTAVSAIPPNRTMVGAGAKRNLVPAW